MPGLGALNATAKLQILNPPLRAVHFGSAHWRPQAEILRDLQSALGPCCGTPAVAKKLLEMHQENPPYEQLTILTLDGRVMAQTDPGASHEIEMPVHMLKARDRGEYQGLIETHNHPELPNQPKLINGPSITDIKGAFVAKSGAMVIRGPKHFHVVRLPQNSGMDFFWQKVVPAAQAYCDQHPEVRGEMRDGMEYWYSPYNDLMCRIWGHVAQTVPGFGYQRIPLFEDAV